ncbi:MAG TPA: ABC transporter substrate-binding protein [Rugosimonospora sp.]|nr:ABC transporter substrate-binding protein [Rugosimonospora sp.]
MALRRAAALVTAVLLPLSAAACTTATGATNAGDLVIAADLELSGAYADVGIAYQRALQLKVEEVNAAGGVRGHRLRLDVRDNRSDPTVSVTDVSAFVDEPGLAAVITGWSGECLLAVAKTLNDKGVPTVSLAPASEVVRPVASRRYIFKVGPNSDDGAAVLAGELTGDKMASVAMVATNDASGNDALQALSRAMDKAGVAVIDTEQFQATDTDLNQPVRSAIAKHPEALVISAFSARALAAARSARTAGYDGRIYFDQSGAGELFLTGMGMQQTNGIAMVGTQSMVIDDVIATTPAKVARRQWFNDYTAKYGNFSEYSTYAADAVQVVETALLNTDEGADHATVRDAIETVQFDGLAGEIHMTPENHSGLTPQALTVLVARGDRWRPA